MTDPLRVRRAVTRSHSISVGGVGAVVLTLLALGVTSLGTIEARRELDDQKVRLRVATDAASRNAPQASPDPIPGWVAQRLTQAPWAESFELLSLCQGEGVAIVGLEPDINAKTTLLRVRTRDASGLQSCLEALGEQPALTPVQLLAVRALPDNSVRGLEFELKTAFGTNRINKAIQ